jgi:plastocyanin
MTLSGVPVGSYLYTCNFGSGGDASFNVTETSEPQTFDNGETCFDASPGDTVWVTIGGVSSNVLTVGSAPPPPPVDGSIQIGWSAAHPSWIEMTLAGFSTGSYQYTCNFASGGDATFTVDETSEPQTFDNGKTCFDSISGDTVWVTIGGISSNVLTVGASSPPPPTSPSIQIGWSTGHPSWISMTLSGFGTGSFDYTCNFASGGDATYVVTPTADPETFDNGETCFDTILGDTVWVTIGTVSSNVLTVGSTSAGASIQIGWSSAHPSWISMTLSGFTPGAYGYTCNFGSGGDASYTMEVTSNPETFDNGETCFDTIQGDTVWVTIGGVTSNVITVPTPPPPSKSIQIGWSSAHPSWIWMTLTGYSSGSYTYTCDFASGGDESYTVGVSSDPETFDNGKTCFDTIRGDRVWVTIGSTTSNTLTVP